MNVTIQFQNKDLEVDSLEKRIKKLWKKEGRFLRDIKELKVYVKIEEGMCYFIVNDSEKGSFSFKE